MATSVYVARFLGVDTGGMTPGALVGTIVGGDDALDTHDGDTSYVLLYRNGDLYVPDTSDFSELTFRWERVSGPAPTEATTTSITVEGAIRRDPTATPVVGYGANFSVIGVGTPMSAWLESSDAYIDRTSSPTPFWATTIEGGDVWRISPLVSDPVDRAAFRITYLRAVIESEGAHPHRLMQRGDGLGMGSGRVYSTGTRQRSSRVYGTF